MYGKSQNSGHANRMLFLLAFAGMIPLLVIFLSYLFNPGYHFFRVVYDNTQNIPSVTSSFNPVMTKVMDLYSKSAPLFALFIFIVLFRTTKPVKITNREQLIKACIFSPFVYVFYAWFFLWHNFELTTAGRPVRFMSGNDVSLLIFYLFLYSVSFFMTYALCYLPVLAYKLWKER